MVSGVAKTRLIIGLAGKNYNSLVETLDTEGIVSAIKYDPITMKSEKGWKWYTVPNLKRLIARAHGKYIVEVALPPEVFDEIKTNWITFD
jgi:hypothetical protein